VPLVRRRDGHLGVDSAVRSGALRRLAPGVYAAADRWRDLTPQQRYLARVYAYAHVHPDATFAFESAAALRGLPLIGEPAEIHVLASYAGASRLIGDVRVHAAGDDRAVERIDGILVTSPEDIAVDIARSRHPAIGLMTADAVLRLRGLDDPALLIEVNETRASSRGRRRARWSLARATPLAETALESISRAVIEWLGFPDPELQRVFVTPDGTTHRGDMYWAEADLLGEADGRVKYDGTYGDGAEALWNEKRRGDMLARMVRGTARWVWGEVRQYTRLRDILIAHGLYPIRPPQSGPLLTLAAALRTSAQPRDLTAAARPRRSGEVSRRG
jgi:hypothetical protein